MLNSLPLVKIRSRYLERINAEKILIAQRNTPATLIGNLLGGIPLTLALSDTPHASVAYTWLGTLYLFTLVRWIHYLSFNKSLSQNGDIFLHGRLQTACIFIAGSIWGSAGIIFFDPENFKNIVFIVLTFVCMLGGSLASLSSRPLAYIAFAAPVMLPLIVEMTFQQIEIYRWMAFGATAYLAATIVFCLNIHHVITRSLSLQYENTDLISDLKEQKERADKANREKSRFLASASHDLRQPLHAINLLAEVLSGKVQQPEQKQDLDNIKHGLNSLSDLLDVLLDISRLDSESVRANKINFDISEIFSSLKKTFYIDAQERGLEFNVSNEKHFIFSDPLLIERVITNLLVNAFRYTNKGQVKVFYTLNDDTVNVHIADTGVGIEPEHLEMIFDEFFQVGNQERNRQKGLGLGLAIVKRILDLLEHTLEVKSIFGQGTEVVLSLPLGQEAKTASENVFSNPEANFTSDIFKGVNILLVDNEPDIVDAMEKLLRGWGLECLSAISTESALDHIESGYRPTLLLVDYRMPGPHNGCSFIQKARSVIGTVPAIVITGDSSEEVINEITAQGLVYLRKPIKAGQLRTLITRMLKEK
ncbi:ATP-binding response regulator [Marinobacterium sediminicola]|uniref:histidine kinase n=1 Tax=Marinobacterium sediminicola TaxID=518898 RepID=A0ABY1S0Z9_9GAMM|nr:hybrid sensor histidine kinase/response regulator [Marinobacterium sediminicola]ULG69838.1 hybrid sensor histidine kinase/response regulator [Marinobacterium sediminicola]SMR75347.1 Signal transduction histidine kinase [Marinobacterium sediminicola]